MVAALLLMNGPVQADGLPETPATPGEARQEAVPLEEHAPHRGFVGQLGRDYAHFASRTNLLVLGAGGLAALGAHPYDRRLTDNFRNSQGLDDFFEIGDVAGGAIVQGGVALGAVLVGRLAHSPKLGQLGGDLVRAQIVAGTITLGIKVTVRRDRPDGTGLSFPSGHTSASFATATVLERHFGWKLGVPAYALATYIGGSRLQANKHFASDVLFGAAVGIAAGRAVSFEHGRKHVVLAPFVVPGGGGIAVVGQSR
jgi:hypothetical protein